LPAPGIQRGIGSSLNAALGIPVCFSMPGQIDSERSSGLTQCRVIENQTDEDKKTDKK
jgi:hypothetical protein